MLYCVVFYLQQHGFQPAEGRPQVFKTIKEGPPLEHAILLYKTVKYDCPFVREDYPVKIALSSRIYLEVGFIKHDSIHTYYGI